MIRALAPFLLIAVQALQPAVAATTKPLVQFEGCALPLWPLPSLRAEHSGVVMLSYLIGADGRVRESRIKKSSGHAALDLAAQEGIERCSFTPGTENGKPVTAWMDMQYVWTLEQDDPAVEAKKTQEMLAAAERGDAESQYKLAWSYFEGRNVEKDEVQGRQWLLKAAEQGLASAQAGMGMLEGKLAGAPRTEAAMVWYRKAAEQGDASALFMVATSLMEAEKIEEAMDKLDESADKGFPIAQEILGGMLIDSEDEDQQLYGFTLLQKAADQSMNGAIVKLANCYASGKVVARDDGKAAKLYSQAAANGNVVAKIALAGFYENGRGVNKNPERAKRLMQEASEAPTASAAAAGR